MTQDFSVRSVMFPSPHSPPIARFAADAGHLAPHAHATPTTVQGSELMRFAAAGDATLLIGGDLIVTVCQVSFAYMIQQLI